MSSGGSSSGSMSSAGSGSGGGACCCGACTRPRAGTGVREAVVVALGVLVATIRMRSNAEAPVLLAVRAPTM
jgi:hypothetical protein